MEAQGRNKESHEWLSGDLRFWCYLETVDRLGMGVRE